MYLYICKDRLTHGHSLNTVVYRFQPTSSAWSLPVVECFGPFIQVHPRGSGPAVVISHYVSVVGFQLWSERLYHSQLDVLSAANPNFLMAARLSLPFRPIAASIFQSDWAAKPRVPTSTGKSHVLQPFCLHCSRSSAYLANFLS